MKLTIEEIKDFVTGAVEVELRDGMFRFYRFAPEQAERYLTVAKNEDFHLKTFATAGVRLECVTDASALRFRFSARRCSSRQFCYINGYVDGEPAKTFGEGKVQDEYEGTFELELPEGTHRVTVYLPNFYGMAIGEVELENATFAEPYNRKYTMVCYGDSITQGYDAIQPAVSYVNVLADLLDAAPVDKGIGGDRFFPDLLEINDGVEPDLVTVAYGTNDWSGATREKFEETMTGFMKGLAHRYPKSKIFVITPIWRGNWQDTTKKAGGFLQVSGEIKAEAEKYGFTVIEGMDLVPHDPAYFVADQLHPNEEGMKIYAEKLAEKMQKQL
ncbi:MAG: SGNH/GDSL hydrolase family protein [Clostridia bacterium]|nr:SGNH/GDSL hydrolase family protein [Clostridia bacterium]